MKSYFFKYFLLTTILGVGFLVHSQTPTIGLLFHESETSDGYTLFSPEGINSVYLINNCGEKINEWIFSEAPGQTCYFLTTGTLLRAGKDSLEIRDWENNLLWSYPTSANGIRQHHDIQPLPNGNILCLVRDIYSQAQMIAAGRDSSNVFPNFWLDKLVELSPVGTNDAIVVWEWKYFDHLIQDFDATKANYGIVHDHPELLDINFQNGNTQDYTHVNAVCYNAELDQILMTARHLGELHIIDHTTTTQEAAGHTGGNSGMGGDFLWRWGNSEVYREGGAQDQKLFLPHDGKWVETGYLDEGKMTVFNNGGDGTLTFSSIHLITPTFESGAYVKENNVFAPLDFEWSWSGSILGGVVYEQKQSGTQSLPNGNLIICQTSLGQVSELTKNGEHLWTYKNPVCPTGIYNQYEVIPMFENMMFRAEKYPETYPGFNGLDMTPKGLIENLNTLSESCILADVDLISSVEAVSIQNPVEGNRIRFDKTISVQAITITDLKGKMVLRRGAFEGNSLSIDLKPSLYILQLYFQNRVETHKIIVP